MLIPSGFYYIYEILSSNQAVLVRKSLLIYYKVHYAIWEKSDGVHPLPDYNFI